MRVTVGRGAEGSRLSGEDSTIWGNVEFEVLMGIQGKLCDHVLGILT